MHPARDPDPTSRLTAVEAGRDAHPGVAPHEPVGDKAAFLRGFLRHPDEVGSVIPSSPFLERRIVRMGGIAQARSVVELGPGTGGTTRALLRAMPGDGRLLAIELTPMFHARLTHATTGIGDSRCTVQLGSAEEIEAFVAAHRMAAPAAVVSGIPFSTMPAEVADRIAAAVARVLAPGGVFLAYQVRRHVAHFVEPYLGAPEATAWEAINIPPMRLFRWRKPA